MKRFEWQQSYETGNSVIDGQHKQLLELANLVFEAFEEGKGEAVLDQAFEALFVYTNTHFRDEEVLWEEISTPLRDEHQLEHGILIDELNKYHEDSKSGPRTDVARHVAKWMETRFMPHMMKSDPASLKVAKGG